MGRRARAEAEAAGEEENGEPDENDEDAGDFGEDGDEEGDEEGDEDDGDLEMLDEMRSDWAVVEMQNAARALRAFIKCTCRARCISAPKTSWIHSSSRASPSPMRIRRCSIWSCPTRRRRDSPCR